MSDEVENVTRVIKIPGQLENPVGHRTGNEAPKALERIIFSFFLLGGRGGF